MFMRKLQVDNEKYVVYSPDTLKYITDNMYPILDERIEFYKSLFDVKSFRKIQINYFDNVEEFREYIYSLRGERTSLPQYAVGTFDNGMINAYVKTAIVGTPAYEKILYLASHELFHIMYQELIWEKENKKRIVWFDEGMAQLFSGEYHKLLKDNNFDNWLDNLITKTEVIPDLNKLSHGTSFVNSKYNGYALSLLAVKYLFDTLEFSEFKRLMHDTIAIEAYGKNILTDAINFYKNEKKENKLR